MNRERRQHERVYATAAGRFIEKGRYVNFRLIDLNGRFLRVECDRKIAGDDIYLCELKEPFTKKVIRFLGDVVRIDQDKEVVLKIVASGKEDDEVLDRFFGLMQLGSLCGEWSL